MNIEKGLAYSFVFKNAHRLKAARLAYELGKAQGVSKKSLVLNSILAFAGRSVTLKSSELEKPHCQEIQGQLQTFQQKKIISRVVTSTGFDPVRRRGAASKMTRRAVIRTWPYKGIKRPGHAALSIKDSSPQRSKPKNVYFSWWPKKDKPGFYNNLLRKIGLGMLTVNKARFVSAYSTDKRDEISRATQAQLMSGAGHYDEIEQYGDVFSEHDKSKAQSKPLQPRARQVRLKGTHLWGMQADKVYVPLIGPNHDINTKQQMVSIFGLDEAKMEAFAREQVAKAKEGQADYEMASNANSCSGMIIRTLQAGGADLYTKTNDAWLITDPNTVHTISVRVQERVDDLNAKASRIMKEYKREVKAINKTKVSGAIKEVPHHNLADISALWPKAVYSHQASGMPSHIEGIQKAIRGFDDVPVTLGHLLPKAISLVEKVDKALVAAQGNVASQRALTPALIAVNQVWQLIEEAYQNSMSDQPVTPGVYSFKKQRNMAFQRMPQPKRDKRQ